MAQITVDDQLIGTARSLVEGEGITDEEIMDAALWGWVVKKKNMLKAIEEVRRTMTSETPWDPPEPDLRQPVWQP